LTLEELSKEIKACQRCELRMTATSPVPGYGEIGAEYFLIGEAPGQQEDAEGIPFVGRSGQRLNKLLELAGIAQADVYLSNVCRCRPMDNKTPKKKEVNACKEFLMREIRLVKPQLVITLGSTPLSLFTDSGGVSTMHGTVFESEIPDDD